MHHLHPVVAKAVIVNSDGSKLLVLRKNNRDEYSLPGGHIDAGEMPEDAMRRELFEECGVQATSLDRIDFFRLQNDKIVLAYRATIDTDTAVSQQGEKEGAPTWITPAELDDSNIDDLYKQLIADHWINTPPLSLY